MKNLLLILSLTFLFPSTCTLADEYILDLFESGYSSWDELGDPDNDGGPIDLGTNGPTLVTGMEYSLIVETVNPSVFGHTRIRIETGEISLSSITIIPAPGNNEMGEEQFDFAFDLSFLDTDGLMNIEFYESLDNNINELDALYLEGSFIKIIHSPVPEPMSGVLIAAGLVICQIRRRRD